MLAAVSDIALLGQQWAPEFRQVLTAEGWGVAAVSLPALASDAPPLPWHNIDQVRITFDSDVPVSESDLVVRGVRNPYGYAFAAGGFNYNPATFTAIWTLAEPLRADSLSLQVASDIGGSKLDGRRVFSVDVLPTGALRNGVTDRFVIGGNAGGLSRPGDTSYELRGDINGDAVVNLRDQALISRTVDAGSPLGDPGMATNAVELAAALRFDPTDIYEYVLNNIHYEAYAGARKSSQRVIDTGAANGWDIGRLLIDAYEASGVDARHVSGRVSAPWEDVANLVDVQLWWMASNALDLNGLDGEYVAPNIRFNHAWVEADVWSETQGMKSIQLDASWKLRERREPIDLAVVFDETAYLSSRSNGAPGDFYARQVAKHLADTAAGVSLSDIPFSGPIVQTHVETLPDNLPFELVGATTIYEEIPDDLLYRVNVRVDDEGETLFEYAVALAEDDPDAIVVGVNSSDGRIELYVDGVVVAGGMPPDFSTAAVLYVGDTEPGAAEPSYFSGQSIFANEGFTAIGFNAHQHSAASTARQRALIADADKRYLEGDTLTDYELYGQVLGLTATRYYQMVNEDRAIADQLTHYRHSNSVEYGLFHTRSAGVDVFPDQQIVVQPRGVGVSILGGYPSSYLAYDAIHSVANVYDTISVHESLVIEDVLNTPGLSTVSSIQYANENGIPVFEITGQNFQELFPQLNLPSHIKSQVLADFNAVGRVVVPRDMTPINGFNGVGWWGRGGIIAWTDSIGAASEFLKGGRDTGDPEEELPIDECQQLIYDPVGVALGNVYVDAHEFAEQSGVAPLSFSRHYDSLFAEDRGLGVGWMHNCADFLRFEDEGVVIWRNSQNREHKLMPNGFGGYDVPLHVGGTFVATTGRYEYKSLDGDRHQFDASGKLIAMLDRHGNGVQLDYDSQGRLMRIHDVADAAHKLTFAYDGDNTNIASITTWDGRTWYFTYLSIGDAQFLASVRKPDSLGRVVEDTYKYYGSGSDEGLLRESIDPRGSTTTYEYYANRRARQVTDAEGGIVQLSYNYIQGETRVIDERGDLSVFRYGKDARTNETVLASGARLNHTWTDGRLTATIDGRNFKTTIGYDGNGNLTNINDSVGLVAVYAYDPVFNQPIEQTTQVYVPNGTPVTQTYGAVDTPVSIPDQQTVSSAVIVSDSLGQIVDIDVSLDIDHTFVGNLTLTLISPNGARTKLAARVGGSGNDFQNTVFDDEASQSISNGFPPFGGTFRPQQALTSHDGEDANGVWKLEVVDAFTLNTGVLRSWSLNVTTRQFTTVSRTTHNTIDPLLGLPTLSSRPGGVDTGFTYTPKGLVKRKQDPLDRITEYEYDALGRLKATAFAFGTDDQANQLYEYDDAGNQISLIDENGNRTEFEYDLLDRLVLSRDALGLETTYRYDLSGNLVETRDARGNVTRYEYDGTNRLLRMVDARGATTKYEYDPAGNQVSITDPVGNTTHFEYDTEDRLIETIDPEGGRSRFAYDGSDNLVSLIDPVGNTTRFVYDARGRRIKEIDPLGKNTEYSYDNADNLTRKVDRNDRETQYEYDSLDRLRTERWIPAGGGPDANLTIYDYDHVGNLRSVDDEFSALAFTYDKRDRVKTVDNVGTPGALNVVLTYAYDGVGNVTSVSDTANGGATTVYHYDKLNRVDAVDQTGANISEKAVDFVYNELGQYSRIDRYSDLAGTQLVARTSYSYDLLNRLGSIEHGVDADSRAIAFYDYEYDAASRTKAITDVDGRTDYAYDAMSQLIAADRQVTDARGNESYAYDANGNREESHRHDNDYVIPEQSANQLQSDGTYNYQYDDQGNTFKRTRITGTEPDGSTVREFTWDHRNRLTAVIDKLPNGMPTQRVGFTYDALDRRISKSVDTTPLDAVDAPVTHFVYDRDDVILDIIDVDTTGPNQPTLSKRYLHGPAIDQVLAQDNAAGAVHWHLTDHLGTVHELVDNAGNVVNHILFDAFGNVIDQTNALSSTRYLFTGRESDPETGLHYYRNRYYDSSIGRFISEDPIGFFGKDTNTFRYVRNSPTDSSDPLGFQPIPSQNEINAEINRLVPLIQHFTKAVEATEKVIAELQEKQRSLRSTLNSEKTKQCLIPNPSTLLELRRLDKEIDGLFVLLGGYQRRLVEYQIEYKFYISQLEPELPKVLPDGSIVL